MTRTKRIAIVGAGLSGLATAVYLKRLGASVTVLEASSRVGGVIHTECVDVPNVGRFVLDHGADMFATNPSSALELCRELGIEDRLIRPKTDGRGAMIARGNALIPIPEGFVLMRATKIASMITTPLLSVRGKLRLLAERLVRRRDESVTDESVGSFVRRRMGTELLDNIVAPLVAGIYTADVERLSMAATMKPIWEMESEHGSLMSATLARRKAGDDATEKTSSGARYEQFRAFPGGMIEWMQTMATAIGEESICLQTRVDGLKWESERVVLQPDHEPFDEVVLALPAAAAATILRTIRQDPYRSHAAAAAEQLQAIPTASTAIVVMAVHRDAIKRMPSTFGFVVPPREQRHILAGSFASEKFEGRAPDDYVIVRAFVGGVLQPEVLDASDDAIIEIVRGELSDLIGLDQQRTLAEIAPLVRVVRWNNAMPQYEVGHLERVQTITRAMESMPPIHLAGNSLHGVGIAPVIGSAKRLAERLMNQ